MSITFTSVGVPLNSAGLVEQCVFENTNAFYFNSINSAVAPTIFTTYPVLPRALMSKQFAYRAGSFAETYYYRHLPCQDS
jgi:hypothetical protein